MRAVLLLSTTPVYLKSTKLRTNRYLECTTITRRHSNGAFFSLNVGDDQSPIYLNVDAFLILERSKWLHQACFWACFTGNVGYTSERRRGALMGFPNYLQYLELHWTEPGNSTNSERESQLNNSSATNSAVVLFRARYLCLTLGWARARTMLWKPYLG